MRPTKRHVDEQDPRGSPLSRLRQRKHLAYAAVITCIALVSGSKGMLPVFRSNLMEYLGIGDAYFGLLFGIGGITGLGGVLFGGRLIDRWGPRRVIRVCLVGVGAAMLVVASSGASYPMFVIAACLSGLFSPPLFIAISVYLAKLFPRHRRRVISLNLASTSMGGMVFPLAAEGLLRLSARRTALAFRHILHLPFLATGALLLAASFIYRAQKRSRRTPVAIRPRANRRPYRMSKRVFPLALMMALHGVADGTLHLWMPRFLESRSFAEHRLSPGLVLSGYALAYLLSRGALALLPDRRGQRALLVWPGILGGSVLLAGILSRRDWLTSGGYILGALCWSAEYPALVSRLMHEARRHIGASMAMAGLISGLLYFVSAALMGGMLQRLGEERMWQLMLAPASLFVLIGIGGLAWLLLAETGHHSRSA